MPSKRYVTYILPIAHMNGKLANNADKCPNVATKEDQQEGQGFVYGYKRKDLPNVSRFGVRKNSRVLSVHPYTEDEIKSRKVFADSLQVINDNYNIPANWSLMLSDYYKQSNYNTPRGFAMANVIKNGGVWLSNWSS